ncbi:hypothetical protein ACWD0F_51780, partial [Nonomuraea sp. NPDC002799]
MTVTELTPVRVAPGMDARWTPIRAGIVNVWRYYDEVFEFHRGRLLLRGPNGSGKSKVLELLLPYVLDASLKPSRLSTFGGTERTMHWNLMGDGAGGTTRVGYVWLEFQHADGRWFTCGARLQATVHTKNVTAAYFTADARVSSSSARVRDGAEDRARDGARDDAPDGVRLTGAGGQPLTKAQLAEELGTSGKVHDSAEAYRTVVRQTLYRALNEQRYDSLLTALRQLRTPKLSERLDPGLLSELLSSALPPLGEGEIHEIAEGFERLDRQREELRLLDRDVDEAERLAARQRGYAQRVLRAAAAAVTSAGYTLDSLAAEAKAKREALKEAEQELHATTVRLGEEEAQELALAAQIDGLKESDAYKAGSDLHRLRTEAQAAHETAARFRDQAGAAARSAMAKQELSVLAESAARTAAGLADRARTEARQAAERAGLLGVHEETERAGRPPHDTLRPDRPGTSPDGVSGPDRPGAFPGGVSSRDRPGALSSRASTPGALPGGGSDNEEVVRRARDLLRAAVTSRAAQIREVRAAALAHEEAIHRRTTAEQDRDRVRDDLATATATHEQAERDREDHLRDLTAALAEWAARCTQLQLVPDEVASLADRFEQADDLVGEARTTAAVRLAAHEQRLTGIREQMRAERAELARERERLDDQTLSHLSRKTGHTLACREDADRLLR